MRKLTAVLGLGGLGGLLHLPRITQIAADVSNTWEVKLAGTWLRFDDMPLPGSPESKR